MLIAAQIKENYYSLESLTARTVIINCKQVQLRVSLLGVAVDVIAIEVDSW